MCTINTEYCIHYVFIIVGTMHFNTFKIKQYILLRYNIISIHQRLILYISIHYWIDKNSTVNSALLGNIGCMLFCPNEATILKIWNNKRNIQYSNSSFTDLYNKLNYLEDIHFLLLSVPLFTIEVNCHQYFLKYNWPVLLYNIQIYMIYIQIIYDIIIGR